ncbi:hypothetical protein [Yersinia pseudotuberculosis]|uniref:hypothetical protein n=1 Tax=Yersinia pseudotuberculosis TaxID=633 RepID=UPI00092D343B|nr:hypothetical protein [Yersinia pseudotuberculosis]AXY32002.1 hypothetical protein CEQ20_00415 [Yersinia pseudotuberculosis]AYX11674.1 hypothetical protein EGX52_13405 [Yersinia pseudotuberculosis]MBO1588349.1 hypothetical protein [Yersinia pseudotuberculosis]PEI15551.1 hypothetical protein CRM78_21570 [Yersinia pseudotuberculosis]
MLIIFSDVFFMTTPVLTKQIVNQIQGDELGGHSLCGCYLAYYFLTSSPPHLFTSAILFANRRGTH